jgi:hypothetical protein
MTIRANQACQDKGNKDAGTKVLSAETCLCDADQGTQVDMAYS